MQVIINNLPINYSIIGSGKKILMLHGWGDRGATYTDLAKALSSDYECIMPDLPGFGSSGTPDTGLDLQDFAQYTAKFLDKIHAGQIHALIGHSNGGAIAVSGIANHILSSDKLILLASSGVRSDKQLKKIGLKTAAKAAKYTTKVLPPSTREKLRRKTYKSIGSDMFVSPNLQETFKKIIKHDVRAEAKNVNIPTLLLYGSEDKITPPSLGQALSDCLPNSELIIVEGAGHFIHGDKLEETLENIRKFL